MKNQYLILLIICAYFSIACTPLPLPRLKEDLVHRAVNSLEVTGEKSQKIAIVSHSTLNVKYVDMAIKNHQKYANLHGYDYIFRNNLITEKYIDPDAASAKYQLGFYWQKIQAVKEALDAGYNWVMWIDADTLFTDFNKKIEDVVAEYGGDKIDFLISADNTSSVNTGIFLMKQSGWSHKMLENIELLYPYYKNENTPEQLAVQDFLLGFAHIGEDGKVFLLPENQRRYHGDSISKAVILPQRILNAYYKGSPFFHGTDAIWRPGDFIAHFAVMMGEKESEMKSLTRCFTDKCGQNYELYNECIKQCS